MTTSNENDWNEYSNLVLHELKRLNEGQEALRQDVQSVKTEIALLKLKSGVWGVMGGAIPVAIALLVGFFKA